MGVICTNNNNEHNLYTNRMAIGDYKCICIFSHMGPKVPKRSFRCEINKMLTNIARIQNIFPMRCLSFNFIMWVLEIYFGTYEKIGL
jgi:hypothetical protein